MRVAGIFAIALALACAKGPAPKPAGIQADVRLAPAATCDSLLATIRDTAVRQMRAFMEAEKSGGFVYTAAADGSSTPGSAPASFSTTNTQVAGVDEADFMKNDGTRIFTLSGQALFAARSWPPQDLSVQGKLDIEGWPGDMFLDGDQVVVFSTVFDGGTGFAPCPLGALCFAGASRTKITVADVSDLSAPRPVAEIYLPGFDAGSRKTGSLVRVVLHDGARWPAGIQYFPDYDPALYQDHDKLVAALDALEDRNEALIRAAPLSSWIPDAQRKLTGGTLQDLGYRCEDFYLSNAPERLGFLTVATIDLANLDRGVSRTSLVADPGTIYATQDRLYVANAHWWWWQADGEVDWTYVHEFDLTDPARARYVGSGGVEGHVNDQFAMDEKDGYLRIATTTMTLSQAQTGFREHLSSALHVLAPSGNGRLATVGGISPLVEGEGLQAARFEGDRGYAVTFKQVDPLVTLDLTDPAHPRKVAELTLPGFSSYLQPIDGTHLLAIGSDVPLDGNGQPDWSRRALQLSLFDVGDLEHPTRTAQALIGTSSAYSEALWDHHAFNWYQPEASQPGLLAIPFSDWRPVYGPDYWNSFVSDVRVFSVTGSGIAALGGLGMGDVYVQAGDAGWSYFYRPWVRRSVLATGTDGARYVYAVSDAGLRAARLDDLAHPLATALFPR